MGPTLQPDLFNDGPADQPPMAGPDGFLYRTEFVSAGDEAQLLEAIAQVALAPARYKSYTARRRIVSYGGQYDYDANKLRPAAPLPAFLLPLRERAAQWLEVPPESINDALVSQYLPGTPLGWHRDVPDFEAVFGLSLAGPARLRFRRYPPQPRARVLDLELAPRSAYLIRGAARWNWQHSVAPTPALRYSITLRTRRASR
jgi:alkylated DNA repair dioxygenase AlkB